MSTIMQGTDTDHTRVSMAEYGFIDQVAVRRFRSLDEIDGYLAELIASRWFARRFPLTTGHVLHDGGRRNLARGWSDGDGNAHLEIPRALRFDWVVLHELAHGTGTGGHGREFCSRYLSFVRHVIGPDAGRTLSNLFLLHRVKHRLLPTANPHQIGSLGAFFQ